MQTSPFPPPSGDIAPAGPPQRTSAQPTTPRTGDETPQRRRPSLSAAGWLAATGATLLLVASIVVVASQWQTITPEIRFSGLVAALLAIYFVAEAGRPRYPSTSTALATLAATLTAPVGIAAASSIDQTWPVCVFVGGLAALVAAEVQSRRWDVAVLKAATVAGALLAAAGFAALTATPVAIVVAVAAAAALGLGAWRRSVVLGVAVGCSPALLALAESGVGAGTLERIGATGAHLAWSAPIGALVAAAVIGVTAHRRNDATFVALAAMTLTSGVVVGLATGDIGAAAWWCLPAVVLVAVETVAAVGSRSVWGTTAAAAAPLVAVPVAIGGLITPLLAGVGRAATEYGNDTVDPSWTIPLGLTAAALAVATVGTIRRDGRPWRVATVFAGAAAAALATIMITGATLFGWPEVAMLAAIGVATALNGRSQGAMWFHAAALVGVATTASALGVAGLGADQAAIVLLAVAVTLTGLAFMRADVTPLDTAAVGTGAALVLLTLETVSVVDSLVALTVSGQLVLYSAAQRRRRRTIVSGLAFVASLLSLWWTTGTNETFIAQVERFGADGADVALGIATLVLLAGGALLRRVQPASSWLAYSPGLGMATAWLLDAQLDVQSGWATFAALGIGVVATGVGGFRRLGAPLVIGSGMIAGTMLISAGPRLAEAPTWTWIAAGGVGLLALAALVERSSRPLVGSGDDEQISLVEQFRREFG